MQGWRISQEDAHNSILNFDTETSFFSVYDGHGGHEVATYCALHLPDFMKNTQAYKDGNIHQALEDVYLEFDHHLTKPEIIKQLKIIAGSGDKKEEETSDADADEMTHLYEEATMSIEELVLKYGHSKLKEEDKKKEESGSSQAASSLSSLVSKLYSRAKKDRTKSADKESECRVKEDSDSCSTSPKAESDDEADKGASEADGCGASKVKKEGDASDKEPIADEESEEAEVKDSNGSHTNGSSDHQTGTKGEDKIVVSAKGKGVGKGLSNTIRKSVEKTQEELEREQREAARLAKRLERKQSLRNKSAEELYRSMVTNEAEDESDEDGDDEEDEDFESDGSSTSEEADGDDGEDGDDEEDEDEGEEEEDSAEVKATASQFSMNLKEEPGSDSGCTAVVAVLRGNQLYVANAGDSRCVLSREGRAIPLSADHKPEDEPEEKRILNAGGVVTGDGRVNGGLNLSRAIGDHAYKQNRQLGPKEQMITALPDIQMVNLEAGDEFFVLACDGIWNSKTNQEVVDFVRPRLLAGKLSLSQICEELFDECLSPNTAGDGTGCDNMTAVIVRLDRFLPPSAGAEERKEVSGTGVKRPLKHDSSVDENGQIKSDEKVMEKRQRVEGDEKSAGDLVASEGI